MPATTHTLNPDAPNTEHVRAAAQRLADGGVVIFPTETVYGIGASVMHKTGLDRLRTVKNRPADQPFTVHLPDTDAIGRYVNLDTQPVVIFLHTQRAGCTSADDLAGVMVNQCTYIVLF